MDLASFVVQPTWKELLIELVSTEQMDPWDIDVGLVAQKYIERVRGMQSMDLRVPANVILAAALLLRFKSEHLIVEDEPDADTFEEAALRDEVLPELVFRVNRPRRRRMTLDELMKSLEDVIRKGRKSAPPRTFFPAMLIEVPELDMDQKMQKVYDKVIQQQDSEGIVLFSNLLDERNAEQVARHLLPVLHLVQDHKIHAWQDHFFGEIFIKILDGKNLPEENTPAPEPAAPDATPASSVVVPAPVAPDAVTLPPIAVSTPVQAAAE
ncbi:segregation/condensation protein A [Candidatus Micrarchaeota archaeon]|nr:segregation/condensation protein A [Candidatus Micrarchaeota archaeon]